MIGIGMIGEGMMMVVDGDMTVELNNWLMVGMVDGSAHLCSFQPRKYEKMSNNSYKPRAVDRSLMPRRFGWAVPKMPNLQIAGCFLFFFTNHLVIVD